MKKNQKITNQKRIKPRKNKKMKIIKRKKKMEKK